MVCEQPTILTPHGKGADWINLHICQRMKARRILRGMSQERLAKALGLSYQQLQRYESGKSRLPSSMLFRAAVALEVPVTYFFADIMAERADNRADDLDKAALRALAAIQSLTDDATRHRLLTLIADLAQAARTGQRPSD